jgi:hypothetical protein
LPSLQVVLLLGLLLRLLLLLLGLLLRRQQLLPYYRPLPASQGTPRHVRLAAASCWQ